MRPTASPVPICRSMSLRICTRAASRPSERLTPDSRIAAGRAIEVSFMRSFLRPVGVRPRSYGKPGRPVQHWLAIMALACFASIAGALSAAEADRPVRIVVLGDSLSAGLGLAAPDALPAKLEKALKTKGLDVAIE